MEHQPHGKSDQADPPGHLSPHGPAPPVRAPSAPFLELRRHVGNRTFGHFVQRMCAGCEEEESPLQAKLELSSPGDPLEQEADRAADEVMRAPEASEAPEIQRACAGCEEDEELRRQAPPPEQRSVGADDSDE